MNELDQLREFIEEYGRTGIRVDANVLLLKLVGDFLPDAIRSFKRTRQFTNEDYETRQFLIQQFDRVVTTPHILAEVSNLASQIDERRRPGLFDVFARDIESLSEEHIGPAEVSGEPAFNRLGLTDVGIALIAKEKLLVLTVDLPLYVFLLESRIDVLNFNHIRNLNWR